MTFDSLSYSARYSLSEKLDDITRNGTIVKDPVYVITVLANMTKHIPSIPEYVRWYVNKPDKAPTDELADLLRLLIRYINGEDILLGIKAHLETVKLDGNTIYPDKQPTIVEYPEMVKTPRQPLNNSFLVKNLGIENTVKLYSILLSA